MKVERTHAAEPPVIGGEAVALKHAPPICNGVKALVERRTLRVELVDCPGCLRRLRARPQLAIAMRWALQPELPQLTHTGESQ